MNGDFLRDHFTEFDWEKELRRDDGRIRTYLKLLPKYQDLPDEDKRILREVQKDPALRLPDGDTELLCALPYDGMDEEEDNEQEEDGIHSLLSGADDPAWESTRAAVFYKEAGLLARNFVIFSSQSEFMTEKEVLVVLALYGKILSMSNELIDMELSLQDPESEQPPPSLRIAYCKRILSDLNDLLGAFLQLEEKGNMLLAFSRIQTSGLNHVRDSVLKLLLDLRKETK